MDFSVFSNQFNKKFEREISQMKYWNNVAVNVLSQVNLLKDIITNQTNMLENFGKDLILIIDKLTQLLKQNVPPLPFTFLFQAIYNHLLLNKSRLCLINLE